MLGGNLLNTSSMSATGNPRNKCVLKPGFSLMGWVRLCNSGADLAGTNGTIISVSTVELAKHNKRNDAWMAIRGKVYNVTKYMDYHPGGEEELMRGVGQDATLLFNEVHAWVNYQQLLAKCYVGPLSATVQIDKNHQDIVNDLTATLTNTPFPAPRISKTPSTKVVPRFDWIQKRDEITVYVYTKNSCNPGLLMQRIGENNIHLHVQIEDEDHIFSLHLLHAVQWPPHSFKIAAGESGKIEVNLVKNKRGELWPNYGTHTVTKRNLNETPDHDERLNYKIIEKKVLNNDAFVMCLRSCSEDVILVTPIGCHLNLLASINDECIQRSYTPVPVKFIRHQLLNSVSPLDVHFLIKHYTNGRFSSHLNQLQVHDSVKLSIPMDHFKLNTLLPHRRFAFLAAGSGLTPFLSIIEHLLRRNINRIENLQLYYFNKTEADVWCGDVLERMQINDERFHLTNILSQPNNNWQGLIGHVRKDLLSPLLDKSNDQYVTYVAICGPTAFNKSASEVLLQTLQFNAEYLHVF